MSSAKLETSLEPECWTRRLVLLSGYFLLVMGIAICLSLPFDFHWRLLLTLVWVFDTSREISRMTVGMRRTKRLRIDTAGQVVAEDANGDLENLTLLSGSVVLRRFAWLRLEYSDNLHYAELFHGDPDKDLQWQRLQLIWQQAGSAFARSG